MSQIDNSRRFYEKYVAPMIHSEFGIYESRIAVGLTGEGSDCFGYDDFMSRDHDFGTGVCLWLADSDMELFGSSLRSAYDSLIEGLPGNNLTDRLRARRGVMSVNDFYSNVLGVDVDAESGLMDESLWLSLDHSCLATATNGSVFRDDLGAFSSFRSYLLSYYPDRVWRIRLSDELHKFASALQVNYARCMSRGDLVAARLCQFNGLSAAMELFFLLHRQYPPYYKWTYRRITEIEPSGLFRRWIGELSQMDPDISVWEGKEYSATYLNLSDGIVLTAERIAEEAVKLMQKLGLINSSGKYLENHVNEILRGVN